MLDGRLLLIVTSASLAALGFTYLALSKQNKESPAKSEAAPEAGPEVVDEIDDNIPCNSAFEDVMWRMEEVPRGIEAFGTGIRVIGRVSHKRLVSKKVLFFDIDPVEPSPDGTGWRVIEDGNERGMQVLCQAEKAVSGDSAAIAAIMENDEGQKGPCVTKQELAELTGRIQLGDVVRVAGYVEQVTWRRQTKHTQNPDSTPPMDPSHP